MCVCVVRLSCSGDGVRDASSTEFECVVCVVVKYGFEDTVRWYKPKLVDTYGRYNET